MTSKLQWARVNIKLNSKKKFPLSDRKPLKLTLTASPSPNPIEILNYMY